jgi:outer membrane protein assembly factor BamD
MDFSFRALSVAMVGLLILPGLGLGAVVFKPGEKAKYVAPGEEEISGNAQELFKIGQEAEKAGNIKRAIGAYRTLVRKYPKDGLAPGAGYRSAELQEQVHSYLEAAAAYRYIVERYPSNPHFNDAIEAQFRIGEMYLNGKKIKFLGISFVSALDRAVEIFAAVIRTAPYGKYTARAQFDIGLAREKQGANDAALQAYQAVVDKFPNDPIASDAQYQIGYIWFTASRQGTKDKAATDKAKTAFQDFLFRYPKSEKGGQARANLQLLGNKETMSSFSIAKYYDKQKKYRAAAIYYNEVIRQQPGSAESEQAKKRIEQLRAKYGEAALKSAFEGEEEEASKKKSTAKNEPEKRGAPTAAASLPPSETDAALPPADSLMPDTAAAPAPSATPEASPEKSAAPEESASPAASATSEETPGPAERGASASPEATATPAP